MREFLLLLQDRRASFVRPPCSLPADLRPLYRIALLTLMLDIACQERKATLGKLYALNWALKTEQTRTQFWQCLAAEDAASFAIRYEPSLGRAIDFALAEGLLAAQGRGRMKLTDKGRAYAFELQANGCLDAESRYLEDVKARATERRIGQLLREDFR